MTDNRHHITYLGLGSNLGDRNENLRRACEEIEKLIGHIVRQSAFVETEPWGFESANSFLNAVVCVETSLTPRQLLSHTQQIERSLGKTAAHATERECAPLYHDRPVDIDILLYDRLTVDEPDLQIPHPLMHQRDFVMKPLLEILPPAEADVLF